MRKLQPLLTRAFTLTLAVALLVSVASAGDFEFDSSNGSTRSQARDMKRKIRASMFLHRTTFGPTIEEIDALAVQMKLRGTRRACSEWIDAQMALPPTLHQDVTVEMFENEGYTGHTDNSQFVSINFKSHAWWDTAIQGEDQLRQRMAWALIQILVTSDDGFGSISLGNGRPDGEKIPRWLGVVDYYDLMVEHAFGNYRELLDDVTHHPIMGVYLSHVRNRKSNGVRFPDENFAREIMQLFTIGLYELGVDGRLKKTLEGELKPTYDNETIKAFARIFTGLTYARRDGTSSLSFYSGNDYTLPMEMFQGEHDTDPKTLTNGEVVDEANSDGAAEVAKALDNLFNHDNVAPFISLRLIQRFVKSNPSAGYVRRVATKFNNNGSGVKGDLGAVIKAILLDPEAWRSVRIRQYRNPDRLQVSGRGTEYSRLREPLLRFTHLLRSADPSTNYPTGKLLLYRMNQYWNQEPYKAPSVFNFWLADYQPSGDTIGFQPSRRIANGNLVAPEFQVKNSVTTNELLSRYVSVINGREITGGYGTAANTGGERTKIFLNYVDEEALFAIDADLATLDAATAQLVDELDLVHCTGTMPQAFKDKIVEVINTETSWMFNNTTWRPRIAQYRVTYAVLSALTSPFAAISE